MRQYGRTLVMLMAFALFAGACTYASTESDEFACAYGGGLTEDHSRKAQVGPGQREFTGVADSVVYLKADVRNYVIDKNTNTGDSPTVDFILAPSKDKVELEIELSIRFRTNTAIGCDLWEEHGRGGTTSAIDTPEGWDKFLATNFRPILENGLRVQAKKYEWRDIWSQGSVDDVPIWNLMQDDIGELMVTELNRALGEDYFCGPTWDEDSTDCEPFSVLIKAVTPELEALTNVQADIQLEKDETTKQREVKARELELATLNADIDLAEAQAQIEVSRVNAEKAAIDAEASAAECRVLANMGIDCTIYEAAQNGSIEFWVTENGSDPIPTPIPTFDSDSE